MDKCCQDKCLRNFPSLQKISLRQVLATNKSRIVKFAIIVTKLLQTKDYYRTTRKLIMEVEGFDIGVLAAVKTSLTITRLVKHDSRDLNK